MGFFGDVKTADSVASCYEDDACESTQGLKSGAPIPETVFGDRDCGVDDERYKNDTMCKVGGV